jgi:hypothetical protein
MVIDAQTKDERWRGSEGTVSSQVVVDAETTLAVMYLYLYVEKIRQDAS